MLRKFWLGLAVAAGLATSAFAAPPLEAYGKLPGFEMAELSPSGDRYAVVGVVGDQRRLLVLDAARKPLFSAGVGDQKVRDLAWAGEDKVLVFGSGAYGFGPDFSRSKYEVSHVTVIDIAVGKATPLLAKGKTGNGVWGYYGVAQEGGRWYGYFGAITLDVAKNGDFYFHDGHPDLYRVDLTTGKEQLVARGADGEDKRRGWLVGPDGAILATFDFDVRSGAWRLRASEQGAVIAEGLARLGGAGIVGQGRTPGTVVYSNPGEDEVDHWMEVPLTGGEAVEILKDEKIDGVLKDRRTRLLAGFVRDADQPEAIFFDPVRQAKVRSTRKAFPGLNMRLVSRNEAFDRFIVFTDGPGDSGTWWLVDLRTGQAADIGGSYPAVRSADVGPMRMVAYKAADGLEMHGVLTLPPGREAKGLPLLVLPHGGPAARDYPNFDWWAQAFAARGYAVFQPNFRGSSGYGEAFKQAGERQWGRKMQTDISDGVTDLARQGIVDPKRACIMGASYGGYAALAGVTLQNGLYRCAVSVGGVSDLQAMLNADRRTYGGGSAAMRDWIDDIGKGGELKTISPARQAARADAPVLLIHGRDDTVVEPEQSRIMQRELKSAGKPVEYVELKGEDHWLSRGESRLAMLQAAMAFVEKHNPAD